VQLPNGTWYGPVLGPLTLTLPPNFALERLRTQTVPATAPAGAYWYQGRVGDYPASSVTQRFPFSKNAAGGKRLVGDWRNDGQDFDNGQEAQQVLWPSR